jgi:hypothetical protein
MWLGRPVKDIVQNLWLKESHANLIVYNNKECEPNKKFLARGFVSYRLVSGYKKIKFINEQNTWSVSLFSSFLPFHKPLIQQTESLFPSDSVTI